MLAGSALLLAACGDYATGPGLQTFMGCPVQQIYADEARSGTLRTSDCRVQGAYAHMYLLDHRREQDFLIIDLESVDFDAYLVLYDAQTGQLLYENDDINEFDTDARLSGTLPRGRYIISATTFEAGETGRYVLTVD